MPKLVAKIANQKYRLQKVKCCDDSYDIQQEINGVWNTVDSFGKVYYGSSRPYAFMGYSFATPGVAFKHFLKKQESDLFSRNN